MNLQRITKSITEDEGFRSKAYHDHRGKLTIGYGTCIEAGISKRQAEALRDIAIDEMCQEIGKRLPAFFDLSETRQLVLVNMAYNLGVAGLFRFKRMIEAVRLGRFDAAADEIIDSEAYRDPLLRGRYARLAQMMREG